MKLYYAPDTCSLSPHIVLRELAIEFELVKVDNRSKLTADGRDFLTINPKGYVAALELDDGKILTEASHFAVSCRPQARKRAGTASRQLGASAASGMA